MLPEGMLRGCTALTQITIPEGVTEIGHHVFTECDNLVRVDIPPTVTSIGNGAFHKCKLLKDIELPDGLTYLGESAFYSCESLEKIVVPEGVTALYNHTFFGCVALADVEIKGQVTELGKQAFGETFAITELVLPEGLKTIGVGAFAWSNIEKINIPDGVERIEELAFVNCLFLGDLVLPKSVKYIGRQAFAACWRMGRLTIMNPECRIYNASDTLEIGALVGGVICGYADSTAADFVEKFEKSFISLEELYGEELPDEELPAEPSLDEESVKQFVSRMYTVALNREEDPTGHADWTGWLLSREMKGADIAQGFILSEEFIARNLSDEEYLKVLYRTFFDREADEAGKQTWLELLADGTDGTFVLAGFVNSEEFCNRNLSDEDYVETLYRTFMGRASDEAGKADWVNYLGSGMDRVTVLEGFSRSVEFMAILAEYGL